jgi:hypothetical protein
MLTNRALPIAALLLLTPGSVTAQSFLEQFSYEGLGFSGIGFDIGPVGSNRLTTEVSGGVRVDYGMIAPRVRVMFGANYFKGVLNQEEILEFERQLLQIVQDPTGDATVDVGEIRWSNLEATLDLQYVFPSGPRFLTYIGLGFGAHIRNGSGTAIENTFVEDALDTIAASADLSLGMEFALSDHFNFTTDIRGTLSSELIMASARAGFMYRVLGSN